MSNLIALPWEPIEKLEELTKNDIVLLRSDKHVNLESFRYWPDPEYVGIFIPENPTSNHVFDWPRKPEHRGNYYPCTHFLKVSRWENHVQILNNILPWKEHHTRAEFAFNAVATQYGLQHKLYYHKPSNREQSRWTPVNGYGRCLYPAWVTKSLRITK